MPWGSGPQADFVYIWCQCPECDGDKPLKKGYSWRRCPGCDDNDRDKFDEAMDVWDKQRKTDGR